MPLLVLFIFGAVILGAGAMLSPAWPTPQPRIGLAAALALALIIGGSVFWGMLFEWDTLMVDYMLFALVIGIFLGGTLSYGQSRAEKQGEILPDSEQGWPGPEDLLFFGVLAVILTISVVTRLDTYSYNIETLTKLGEAVRDGSTFNTLAPIAPETTYFYPPGFNALTAYISQQLDQAMPIVQECVGAVLALLCVWLIYDFGAEVRDKRLGRAMAVALLALPGFWQTTPFLNAHVTALLGMCFILAFVTYAYRFLRYAKPVDAVGAGLLLGATILAEPNAFPSALVALVLLIGVTLFGQLSVNTTPQRIALLAVAAPLIALVGTSPWLINGLLPYRDNPPVSLNNIGWGIGFLDYSPILLLAMVGGYALLWVWDRVRTTGQQATA